MKPYLVVHYVSDIERSKNFFEQLGLTFVREQHGTGPVHYSYDTGGFVFELYPGKPADAPQRGAVGSTLLGFHVSNLEAILSTLLTQPRIQQTPYGRRVVIEDPDHFRIELLEDE